MFGETQRTMRLRKITDDAKFKQGKNNFLRKKIQTYRFSLDHNCRIRKRKTGHTNHFFYFSKENFFKNSDKTFIESQK